MMYHKIIGDREVFSTCKAIQANDGAWISNPSEEQILAAGWEVYVPPVVPPAPQTEPGMDEIIEAVKKMLSTETEALSDEDALAVAALFPTWEKAVDEAKLVETGKRLWFNEKLWKVLQPHVPQAEWTPDTAVSLYVEVSIEDWPAWVQPKGSGDAYKKGAHVSHNGQHWTSDDDNNVWEPGVYGWTVVPQ